MSSSYVPCAACKLLRRKCTKDCVFAPHFPPEQPNKFLYVHKVFGASNVSKLLSELDPALRQEATDSLVYEAECRLRDPTYGCVAFISTLHQRLRALSLELQKSKSELVSYIGPQALQSILQGSGQPHMPQAHLGQGNPSALSQFPYMQHQQQQHLGLGVPSASSQPPFMLRQTPSLGPPPSSLQAPHMPQQNPSLEARSASAVAGQEHNLFPLVGIPTAEQLASGPLALNEQLQQHQQLPPGHQIFEAQPLDAAEAAIIEQQQPQLDLASAGGYDQHHQKHHHHYGGFESGAGSVVNTEFNQMGSAVDMSPLLAHGYSDGNFQIHQAEQASNQHGHRHHLHHHHHQEGQMQQEPPPAELQFQAVEPVQQQQHHHHHPSELQFQTAEHVCQQERQPSQQQKSDRPDNSKGKSVLDPFI